MKISSIDQKLICPNKINSGRSIKEIYTGLGGVKDEDISRLIKLVYIPHIFPSKLPSINPSFNNRQIAKVILLLRGDPIKLLSQPQEWLNFLSYCNVRLVSENLKLTIVGDDKFNLFGDVILCFSAILDSFLQTNLNDQIGQYADSIPADIIRKIGQPTYITNHLIKEMGFDFDDSAWEELKALKPYWIEVKHFIVDRISIQFKYEEI